MKKWFSQLNICYKTAFINAAIVMVAALATLFLIWFNYGEIPFGILLGGIIGTASYVFMGSVDNNTNKRAIATIILTVVRFLIIGAVIFLAAWLYYKLELHYFNVFAVAGSYLVSPIVLAIVYGKERTR